MPLFVDDFLFEGFLHRVLGTLLLRCALCFSLSCLMRSSNETSAMVGVFVLITEQNHLKIFEIHICSSKITHIFFK